MKKRRDPDECVLERLEEIQDELEELVRAAGERDGDDYQRDLRIRVRKSGGRFYLSLTWYRPQIPPGSAVYAPLGTFFARWYKTLDNQGLLVWESELEDLNQWKKQ